MEVETLLEKLFFTTVRLEAVLTDGTTSTGTGFIYSINVAPEHAVHMLVTNKHVVEGAKRVRFFFIAAEDDRMERPKLGHAHQVDFDDPSELFVGHPDPGVDVVVAPLTNVISGLRQRGHHCFFRVLTPSLAFADEDREIVDAMEQVTFLGYPNGLYDTANGMPIARRGITATPPLVDYGDEPIFLIDASVFPGSSGSPVLIADAGPFSVRGEGRIGNRTILLGVLAAVYQRNVPVLQANADGGPYVTDLLDIGIVYKARTIDEVADIALAGLGLSRYTEQTDEPIAPPG